jgi:hypothetical protein
VGGKKLSASFFLFYLVQVGRCTVCVNGNAKSATIRTAAGFHFNGLLTSGILFANGGPIEAIELATEKGFRLPFKLCLDGFKPCFVRLLCGNVFDFHSDNLTEKEFESSFLFVFMHVFFQFKSFFCEKLC